MGEVKRLNDAAEIVWEGLNKKDIEIFTKGFRSTFNAQVAMFPKMMNNKIANVIDMHKDKALAWKLSGAGGGGYLILFSEKKIPNAIRVEIRIKDYWL